MTDTARPRIAEMRRCRRLATPPTPTWSNDQADIDIPHGPDHGRYPRQTP